MLNDGVLVQQGSPKEIYRHPVDEYTAGLFGRYNLLTPALAKALSQHSDVAMQDIGRFVRPEEFVLTTERQRSKGNGKKPAVYGKLQRTQAKRLGHEVVLYTGKSDVVEGSDVYIVL